MSEPFSVIGQVVHRDGVVQHGDPYNGVTEVDWLPAAAFHCEQAPRIPVLFNHDPTWELGRVEWLERGDKLGGLIAVASITADVRDLLTDGPWYWSDSVTYVRIGGKNSHRLGGARLRECSLVRSTANCGTRPVVIGGDLGNSFAARKGVPFAWDGIFERAKEHYKRTSLRSERFRGATCILDHDEPDELDRALQDPRRLVRAAVLRRAEATPPAPTPPDGVGVRRTRADVATFANARGVGGYDYTDEEGVTRHVRFGGTLTRVD